MSMWEPMTERSRRVIVMAQEEAQALGNNYIGTEHILLGILSEGENSACEILKDCGVSLEEVRNSVESFVERSRASVQQEMVFTPRAKRVVEFAFEEARQLNHNYVAPEHFLLGLIREQDGIAGRALKKLNLSYEHILNTTKTHLGMKDKEKDGVKDLLSSMHIINHASQEDIAIVQASLNDNLNDTPLGRVIQDAKTLHNLLEIKSVIKNNTR